MLTDGLKKHLLYTVCKGTIRLNKIKLIILTIFALLLISCSGDEGSIQLKGWELLHNSSPELEKAQNSSGWKSKENIREIETDKASDGHRHIWLRADMSLEKEPDFYYGVTLDRVDLSAAVYLNGILLGETRLDEISNFDQSPGYAIPAGLLKEEKNELYIYLGSFSDWPLGLPGMVRLHSEKSYKDARTNCSLIYELFPMTILVLLFFTMLSLLIKFFYYKNEKEHLFLSLRLLLTVIYLFTLISPYKFLNLKVIFSTWYALTPLVMLTLIYYLQAIYGLFFSRLNRWAAAALTILFAAGLLNYLIIDKVDLGPFIVLLSFSLTYTYSIFILTKMNCLRPDRFKLFHLTIELSTIILVSISALLFLFFRLGGLNDPSMFMLAAALILSANSIIYYSRRDSIRKSRLEELFQQFQQFKGDSRNEKTSRISDSAESKLKKLVAFIGENYAEPLTREELASMIGLNANYMSSIFVNYTGKKLTAYINELRVERAATMLRESEDKIVNIAFAVGFESLATFNRLFKEQLKVTPSHYRQNS